MRPALLMTLLLPLLGCQPPPQRMTMEERAMNSCINMGIGSTHPAYPGCVTRMLQTYVQSDTADTASRRAAAAAYLQNQRPYYLPTPQQPAFQPTPRLQTTCYRWGNMVQCN